MVNEKPCHTVNQLSTSPPSQLLRKCQRGKNDLYGEYGSEYEGVYHGLIPTNRGIFNDVSVGDDHVKLEVSKQMPPPRTCTKAPDY